MPEFIVRRKLAVRNFVNSSGLNELLFSGESLARFFYAAGFDFQRAGDRLGPVAFGEPSPTEPRTNNWREVKSSSYLVMP